ncbi:MAG: hypothetical protein GX235_05530 [Clostridiales bacterium]|nr:hypothetical protein [Clostridiales bacterium]
MSIGIVLQQMAIIFILIAIGIFLYRKSMISKDTSKQISSLIINLCNPALLICSVFDAGPKASTSDLLTGAFIVALSYAILILCSYLIPYILRIPGKEHFAYRLITIYGNVGFIGIPLALALLGSGSLIYVSLSNLVYNILIYTHGVTVIKTAAEGNAGHSLPDNAYPAAAQGEVKHPISSSLHAAKKFVNAGTVSAILTIALYISDIRVPVLISDTLTHIGHSTTFLSMLILGVSVAQMSPTDIFSHKKLYAFTALRMVVVPVLCVFLFRLFTDNVLIISTTALMLAVPSGNMPLILCKQSNLDSAVISRGIILSTLLSFLTIPIVAIFV